METRARSGCGRCLAAGGTSRYGRAGRRRSGCARRRDTCDHGCGPGRAGAGDARQSTGDGNVDDTGHHGARRDHAPDHHPGASCLSDPHAPDRVDHHPSAGRDHPDPHGHRPAGKPSHHHADRQPAFHRSVGERIGGGGNGGRAIDPGVRCGVVSARDRWVVCGGAGRFRRSGVQREQWAIVA